MKTVNDAIQVSVVERIERNLKRLDKIQDEYQYKIDKLIAKRNKELEVYWDIIEQDRIKLQKVKS